jgi:hypothetical protein
MRFRYVALIGLASLALSAGPTLANQQSPGHGVVQGHPYIPPGPCGYGRVEKLFCSVRRHPPGPPMKVCVKKCVPA